MNLTAQDKIRLGFWLLPLVPVLLTVLAYRTAMDAITLSNEAVRSTEVIRRFERILSELKDVEVAQREYVLTGDRAHLKDVESKRKNVMQLWRRTRAEFAFTRSQSNYIAALDPLIPQKFDELRHTVQLYEDGFTDRAKAIVTGESKSLSDIILTINRLTGEETGRLSALQSDFQLVFVRTVAVFTVFLIINILFVWLLFRYMKREIVERKEQEQRVRLINLELEERVAQRTEALRRTNEDLQQFAYIASHDLQEPLRMVRSYMELLKRRYGGQLGADADEFIGYAVDGTKRMGILIQALLDYSRAGEVSDEKLAEHDVEESLRTAIENLRLKVEESGAKITHDPMPNARFDPVRLAQIFQNLVGNALKYRGDAPLEIHIGASVSPQELTFSVKDNGIGIDPENHDRIFGIFKRLHGREYEGAGIGLATVKKIVERHGGRIWLESEAGKGSTFYFTIPNHTHAQHQGAKASNA